MTELDIVNLLTPYVPLVKQTTGKDITLDRVQSLLEAAGHPEQYLRVIHVAGTSGKTSTCYYASAILCASGHNVGMTVSPHVQSITERLQINGQPISVEQFYHALIEFMDIVERVAQQPSYFELLTVFELWYFARVGVDYAVLETGLGGLHDATNVVQNADKVCIITDIGLDHMHVLGTALPEIAAQKAGIMHANNQAFIYQQSDDVMTQMQQRADQVGATLHIQQADNTVVFQQRNYDLAKTACRYLAGRDEWDLSDAKLVSIPGRMETFTLDDGSLLIKDGAHNQQKISAFLQAYTQRYGDQKCAILIALKEGKEYQQVVTLLAPIATRVIVTQFELSQDTPISAIDPHLLAEAFRSQAVSVVLEPRPAVAYQELVRDRSPVKLVIGSFYLLSQLSS